MKTITDSAERILSESSSNGPIDFIIGEMRKNVAPEHPGFKKIKEYLDAARSVVTTPQTTAGITSSVFLLKACMEYKSYVDYKQPWDYKSEVLMKWGKYTSLQGHLLPWDLWANIHYGYFGAMVGFQPQFLFDMGGLFQALKSKVPGGFEGAVKRWLAGNKTFLAALDDQPDQDAIRIGIECKEQFGRKVNRENLIGKLLGNIHLISKTPSTNEI